MASFVIEGGHRLSGEIHPQGAKNEVLQIICATLLTAEEVTVNNCREVGFVAGYARPKERGRIDRVVAWLALH